MVILKNIKKTNNMISADYYPEGKGPKGFMRIEDGKVTEHENASSFAAPHVRNELRRLCLKLKIAPAQIGGKDNENCSN